MVVVGRMNWSSIAAEGQWSVSGFLGKCLAVFNEFEILPFVCDLCELEFILCSNAQKLSQKSRCSGIQPSIVVPGMQQERNRTPV